MTWQNALRKALLNCYNWTGGAALIRITYDGTYDACAPYNADIFRGEIVDFWDQLPEWFWCDKSVDPQEWDQDELDQAITDYIATLEQDNEWLAALEGERQ